MGEAEDRQGGVWCDVYVGGVDENLLVWWKRISKKYIRWHFNLSERNDKTVVNVQFVAGTFTSLKDAYSRYTISGLGIGQALAVKFIYYCLRPKT